MNEYDHNDKLRSSIPHIHNIIQNKTPTIPIEKIIKHDDELILFELPKGFDRSLLNKIKLKKFKHSGNTIKISNDYKGICFDSSHPLPKQTLTVSLKKNKTSLHFQPLDRYVKVFEDIDLPVPESSHVVPRRLTLKKSLRSKTKKIAHSICK